MNTAEGSLRFLVEKWFAPTLSTPVRVTQFSRMPSNRRRYVEVLRPTDSVTIFFFRHDDRTWRVFPPTDEVLTMRAYYV